MYKNDIISYLSKHYCITIEQASKLFFRDTKQAYINASKVLKRLEDRKVIKSHKDYYLNKKLFYVSKASRVNTSLAILNNFIVDFITSNNICDFKVIYEESFLENKIRNDATLLVKKEGKIDIKWIEVDLTHKTSEYKLFKINELYNDKSFKYYKKKPEVIIISNDDDYKIKDITLKTLNISNYI